MEPLKVSQVNKYIKKMFSSDMILSNLTVEGEISSYKKHTSGHVYFSLKDSNSIIKCVMFKSDACNNQISLSEGQKIVVEGYISIYDKMSQYQLYVKKIKEDGIGKLYKEYEKLKKKLEEEGLFKSKYKKELPFIPKKIGVVTSSTGAAIHDIINVVSRRQKSSRLLIYPSLVQGSEAHKEIIKALNYLDGDASVDVIVLARGGGSMEDLFCFNNEELARTVFNLETPIVSAIGHETDFTIVDFISDLRAPTPSAAAELVVPSEMELQNTLKATYGKLFRSFHRSLILKINKMNILKSGLRYNNPREKLKTHKQDVDMIFKDLISCIDNKINTKSNSLLNLEKQLKLSNPLLGLESGYGILLNNQGRVIKNSSEINVSDIIDIKLKDASLKVSVEEIEKENVSYGKE